MRTEVSEWPELLTLISRASNALTVIGLLGLAVLAFWKEWIVSGRVYRRKVKECEHWERRSDEATSMLRQLVAAVSAAPQWRRSFRSPEDGL